MEIRGTDMNICDYKINTLSTKKKKRKKKDVVDKIGIRVSFNITFRFV